MCGIFGYIGKRSDSAKIVFDGLKSLEYRGYDSWGVAVVSETKLKIFIKKAAGKIGNNNVNDLPDGYIAIGHTRWATHGGVTDKNSHPHSDCMGNISVIHNGIFENYEGFKKKLIQKDHEFISETDTEVISHLVEDFNKKFTFSESVKKVFNLMTGLNAIIVIKKNEDKIVAIRNGSPLVIGFGKNENFLASDASALLPLTKDVYFLEDNEMAILEKKNVMVSNAKTGKIVKFKKQRLNWNVDQGERGKYSSFMLKEINE